MVQESVQFSSVYGGKDLRKNHVLKGTLTLKNIPFKMNIYVKYKFCIGHKSDNGILSNKILDDKSQQVCLHGGASTSHQHDNPGNSRYVQGGPKKMTP